MARLSSIQPSAQTAGLLRSSATPYSPRINSSALDIASSELGQLLNRLQRSVLHADADRERLLRTSEFERARVEA
ncbi:Fc.00g077390.m01.CDS01, partial [Cosmosporella sp. VM-42]